jgi:replicative DNA helicase loader DnaC
MMKNVGDLMLRLQKMMPKHIEPAFKTGEELLAWQKDKAKFVLKRWSVKTGR